MSTTVPDFLDLVRKSGVVDAPVLNDWLNRLQQAGQLPDAPQEIAARLRADGLLTDFQARQLLRGKWNGFLLGNYRILDKIGAGGMGTVYLAEHRKLRRKAAVKVLPVSSKTSAEMQTRFYREARAVAAVSHPNVVQAHDIDEYQHVHFLAMEYVDGASLQGLIANRGPLPPGQVADFIRQAASGLEEIHRNGLVHRDLKPANLMVNRHGVIKILDLGLAMFALDGDEGLTGKNGGGGVMGTADYLSPEQAVDPHVVDIRADIYSLGATMYFLLAGRAPFQDGSLTQKLLWHQVKEPPPLSAFRPDVPPGLEAIVSRMMAKDPAHRFQTPAEVVSALEPWCRVSNVLPLEGVVMRPAAETLMEGVAGPDTPSLLPIERAGPLTPISGLPAVPAPEPEELPTPLVRSTRTNTGGSLWGAAIVVVIVGVLSSVGLGIWLVGSGVFTQTNTPTAVAEAPVEPSPEIPAEVPAPWPDFRQGFKADGLQFNGSARLEGNRLRLTPQENSKVGSVFTKERLTTKKFATEFTFQIKDAKADGFAFVIQRRGPNAVGGMGGGHGYTGIDQSVSVGFNFYAKQEMRIGQNGSYKLTKPLDGTGIDLRNGHVFSVRVNYDIADKMMMQVRVTDTETKASVEYKSYLNIPNSLGGDTAHFGFTGATGGESAIQDILNWSFEK